MSRGVFTIFTTSSYTDPQQAIQAVMNKDLYTLKRYAGSLNAVKDSYNNNLLHLATRHNDVEIVKYLLNNHVDKNQKNKWNDTPMDLAYVSHNKQLIDAYYDVDSTSAITLRTQ